MTLTTALRLVAAACAVAALVALSRQTLTDLLRRARGSTRSSRRPSTHVAAALTAVALAALWPLPAIADLASLGALIGTSAATRRANDRHHLLALEAWHQWISEAGLRVGTLGEPLAEALWHALRYPPRRFARAASVAQGVWRLTGDLPSALHVLADHATDPTTSFVVSVLAPLAPQGTRDIHQALATLERSLKDQLEVARDLEARLAGARLARSLVVTVPTALVGVGTLLVGIHAYLAPAALRLEALSGLVLLGCWAWASRLLTAPVEAEAPRSAR